MQDPPALFFWRMFLWFVYPRYTGPSSNNQTLIIDGAAHETLRYDRPLGYISYLGGVEYSVGAAGGGSA